jgi:hypothetical protein
VKQIRQYELGEETSCAPSSFRPPRYKKLIKSDDESIALMASVKLEDGDVKGAVRLLCSDDRLAVPQESIFVEFCRLHPVTPTDRRPMPSTDTSPLEVSPSAVRAAIQSFPNGSSAGPDGLLPQHKDLLIGSADDSLLLVALTDLVNLLLEGKAPPSVQGSLFGAKLLAIVKKNGGIRPIAVWRRLTAKVACNHVTEASAALLAFRQRGFGVSGGEEAAVRTARLYLENSESDKLFTEVDFRNAFNTVRRDSILEAVTKHFPELLPFASKFSQPSFSIAIRQLYTSVRRGSAAGDPLSPLYFCLV